MIGIAGPGGLSSDWPFGRGHVQMGVIFCRRKLNEVSDIPTCCLLFWWSSVAQVPTREKSLILIRLPCPQLLFSWRALVAVGWRLEQTKYINQGIEVCTSPVSISLCKSLSYHLPSMQTQVKFVCTYHTYLPHLHQYL